MRKLASEQFVALSSLVNSPPGGMPHPTTWSRVLGFGVAAAAVEAALQPLLAPSDSEVLPRASRHCALDGKILRGTIPAGTSDEVHLLSLYDATRWTVLRQVPVAANANEVTSALQLLRTCRLDGTVVTGDAMFTYWRLCAQIVEAGGDYCWIVKANQPTLSDDLRLLFGPQPPALFGTHPVPDDFVTVRTVEKAHGRLDVQELTLSSLLCGYHPWPYLAQPFQVVRTR